MRLLTIVEVAGLEAAEANEVLGVEFFVENEQERKDVFPNRGQDSTV